MKRTLARFPWLYFFKLAKFHGFTLVISLAVIYTFYHSFLKSEFDALYRNQIELQKKELSLLMKQPLSSSTLCTILEQRPFSAYLLLRGDKNLCSFNENTKISDFQLTQKTSNPLMELPSVKLNINGDKLYFTLRGDHYQRHIDQLDAKALFYIFPIFIMVYVGLLFFGLSLSKPLRILLAQTARLERKIPIRKRLKLFYANDEWDDIFHTLHLAQESMEKQLAVIKEEDRKNKILLDSITDGIVAVDNDEKILFYNRRFSSKFFPQLSQNNKLKNKAISEVINDPEILSAIGQCLNEKTPTTVKEFSLEHMNRTLYFDIKINPLMFSQNDIRGAVAVFNNVTDTKLSEQMRVDFVANVSHEIRTPLTSIMGFAQVLEAKKSHLDKQYQHYLDRIVHNTERLHSLFTDLLNLSVIESKHKLKKEKVHLKTLIQNIKALIEPKYPDKDLVLKYDLQEKILFADPKLMEQVFTNLIDNACKYSSDPTVQIKISSNSKDEHLRILVSDKGPGISEEHLDRIFERFYRVDESRTLIKGTGVGLSIVKHIINKHKGTIRVESQPNKGTIFFIELPHYVSASSHDKSSTAYSEPYLDRGSEQTPSLSQ